MPFGSFVQQTLSQAGETAGRISHWSGVKWDHTHITTYSSKEEDENTGLADS